MALVLMCLSRKDYRMIGCILMGTVFFCSFLGCVALYAVATVEEESHDENLLGGIIYLVLLFKPEEYE